MTTAMTVHSSTETAALATAIAPALIQIPAAWFLMGSDSGQDCERPVHRVWIDTFLMAATQVTNAEYERFLQRDRRIHLRLFGKMRISIIHSSRSPQFPGTKRSDIASG